MIKNHTSKKHSFFQYLSEQEQEKLAGGQTQDILGNSNFFFQKTDIQTEADNNLNLADDDSSSQTTKYTLSQITIASSITFTLPSSPPNSNSLNNLMGKIINQLFSSLTS
jgi:hypothetical protein